jgi:hypothetical protein
MKKEYKKPEAIEICFEPEQFVTTDEPGATASLIDDPEDE